MRKQFVTRMLLAVLSACLLLSVACTGAAPKTYKMACMGDSITFGVGSSAADKKYTAVIDSEADFIESVQTVATGGAMVGLSPTATAWNTYSLVNRITQVDEDADVIFVFGGTNDYGYTSGDTHGVPLGAVGDTTADTFYGALEVLVKGLREAHPNAILLFATPLQRDDSINDFSPENSPYNVYGNTLEEYRDAIVYICERENIPYIDFYNLEGMRLSDTTYHDYFDDGVHPNDAGHRIVGQTIVAKLDELLNAK